MGRATWGALHTCHMVHPISKNLGFAPGSPPFDAPSYPQGGDTNTISQAATKSLSDLTATASNVSMRVIFDLANLGAEESNRIISPLGQSGQFTSQHYCDQSELWSSGGMRAIVPSEDAVNKAAVSTMRFKN